MNEVILVVDQFNRYKDATKRGEKIDPSYEAQGLAQLIKPFGRHEQRIAIVSTEDTLGTTAYQNAGYETISVNGNRAEELTKFIRRMNRTIDTTRPQQLVIVTTDPAFSILCDQAVYTNQTKLAVWAPGATVPPELTEAAYGYRPLEDLLPNIKIPRVDIRIDWENLYIGLEKRGWKPDPKGLIEALKAEAATLGTPVSIVAYADWTLLSKGNKQDPQRELALLGVETRYQVNISGKNSADMKIADDISTLLERDHGAPDGVDVILLGTCDRDFRPTVERAKAKGKRLVVVGLEQGVSWQLKQVAGEVRYLDQRLDLSSNPRPSDGVHSTPWEDNAELLMRVWAYLNKKNWKWVYTDTLIEDADLGPDGEGRMRRAVETRLFTRRFRQTKDELNQTSEKETLIPNQGHILVQATSYLSRWIPNRIGYCLQERGMPWVDSNFLAKGMAMDNQLQKLGVGQERREVDGWLHLAEKAGLVVKEERASPHNPERIINTWTLPVDDRNEGSAQVDVQPQPNPSFDAQQTEMPESVQQETPKQQPKHWRPWPMKIQNWQTPHATQSVGV